MSFDKCRMLIRINSYNTILISMLRALLVLSVYSMLVKHEPTSIMALLSEFLSSSLDKLGAYLVSGRS